jgi:DNA replication and repair protein RecF
VHLDRARRDALFSALSGLSSHVMLTGTDRDLFAPLLGRAESLRAEQGRLQHAGSGGAEGL